MSRYLAMLKGQTTEKAPDDELPKISNPSFEGFAGTSNGLIQKNEGGFDGFEGNAETKNPEKPPGLLEVIRRMYSHYKHSPEELALALADARINPDRWRSVIRQDPNADLFINPMSPHYAEVLDMLRVNPSLHYAFITRNEGKSVIITLGVRGVAVCEMIVPSEHFDPREFLQIVKDVTQQDRTA